MRYLPAVALAAVATAGVPSVAAEVTLSSPDGGVEISGRLLSYDGDFFRIDSVYGVLTVDAKGVRCTGEPCPGDGPFVAEWTISGSAETASGLFPALIEAFAAANGLEALRQEETPSQFLYVLRSSGDEVPAARIRVRLTSSAEALADLLAEAADLAVTLREPNGEERSRVTGAGLGDLGAPDQSGVLALDAVVPVVSPENPIRAIGHRELALVLAGKIGSWSELGGADLPITVHLPPEGSALETVLQARLLDPRSLSLGTVRRHGDLLSLQAAVIADPSALGMTLVSRTGSARPVPLAGSCGAVFSADPLSIKREDYPLMMPHFYFRSDVRAAPIFREFLAFIGSPSAQGIVKGSGFVDAALEYRTLEEQGDRLVTAIMATGAEVSAGDLRRLVGAIRDAEQLSLSFRFEDGSVALDAQSRGNVGLLADAIRRGAFDGGTLLFAGFSDGLGSGRANLELSAERARTVRESLAALLAGEGSRVALEAKGFGEAMPMACDEDEWGRQANRRVEVWLRRD